MKKFLIAATPWALAFTVLAVALVAVPKANATVTYNDKSTEYGEWSECRANAECGVSVGTKSKTKTITCESKFGFKKDECEIVKDDCTKWVNIFGKNVCTKSVTEELIYDRCKVETPACIVDICENIEGEQLEAPEGYTWYEGNMCYETTDVVPDPKGEEKPSAPVCNQTEPVLLPQNVHVVRNGAEATVKAHILEGNSANIYYKENGATEWQHSLSDVPVTGKWLEVTIYQLKPEMGYTFAVQSAHSCAGGELVVPILIDPPAYGVVFPVTSWELW